MLAVELLSEPVHVPDNYVSGLSHIEDLGDGMLRFTFYKRQMSTYGVEEYVIADRIILSSTAVAKALKSTMNFMGWRCCCAGKEPILSH